MHLPLTTGFIFDNFFSVGKHNVLIAVYVRIAVVL
jgi:hypothetical protein